MDRSPSLAIIGCGTMGRSILTGMLAREIVDVSAICVSVRRPERARILTEELGVRATVDNADAVRDAEVVVLAVKPQTAHEVLAELPIRDALTGKLLISICAGLQLGQLREYLPETRLVRAMPNTPSVVQSGMCVLSPGPGATQADIDCATLLFESVGRVRVLAEKHLDAVTGLSGAGPAYVCVMIQALADGGVMMGLPRDVAVELAAQTVAGTGRLVLEAGLHPAALKDQVTTPAGCTIAGLLTMEDGGVRSALARTVETATQTASRLGQRAD